MEPSLSINVTDEAAVVAIGAAAMAQQVGEGRRWVADDAERRARKDSGAWHAWGTINHVHVLP